ncbi:hypothetical protein BH23PLA1_BH23PLA1_22230 [soil metagenome]
MWVMLSLKDESDQSAPEGLHLPLAWRIRPGRLNGRADREEKSRDDPFFPGNIMTDLNWRTCPSQPSGVNPSTTSNLAASSPILEFSIGVKSTETAS